MMPVGHASYLNNFSCLAHRKDIKWSTKYTVGQLTRVTVLQQQGCAEANQWTTAAVHLMLMVEAIVQIKPGVC